MHIAKFDNGKTLKLVSVVILFLISIIITYYAIKIRPVIPNGNDPITHLELIDALDKSFFTTFVNSTYPLGFHVSILLISKLIHISPINIISYTAPYFSLLVLISTLILGKKLFGMSTGVLALFLGIIINIYVHYTAGGQYPDIIGNQFLVPIIIGILLYEIIDNERNSKILIIILGLLAAVASLTHYTATLELLLYLFFALLFFWKNFLKKRKLLALFFISWAYPSLIVGLINPRLNSLSFLYTLKPIFLKLTGINSQVKLTGVNNVDLTDTKVTLLNFLPNHPGTHGLDFFIGLDLCVLLLISIILGAILIIRKQFTNKIQHKKYVFLYTFVLFIIVLIFLPFFPFGGRLVTDIAPFIIVFVGITIITGLKRYPKYIIPLLGSLVIALWPEINPQNILENINNMFSSNNQQFKELNSYLGKNNTALVLPVTGFLPYTNTNNIFIGSKRLVGDNINHSIAAKSENIMSKKIPVQSMPLLNNINMIIFAYRGPEGTFHYGIKSWEQYIGKNVTNTSLCDGTFFKRDKLIVGSSQIFLICKK